MKKIIVSSVLVLGLVAAGVASANWHRGNNGGGYGGNYNNCTMQGVSQQFSAEDQKKFIAFQKENVELRRQLTLKKAEQRAMLNSDNPDSAAVSKLSGEIFDIQNSLKEKATAAGIDTSFKGGRGGGKMMGNNNRGGMGRMNLDQDTIEKMNQFADDNSAIYKKLTMKQAEQRALMRSENVDPAKAAAVAGELFDLRTSLQEKAEAADVPYYAMGMGQGGGKMQKGGGKHGNMSRGNHHSGWSW